MIGAIIQARTGSTRLPNKVLLKLQGKSVLEHVVQRVKRSKKIDKVVVATTTKKEDDRIVNICKKLNIDYFRGSEEGVLDRYFQTARLFQIDPIVRITADCPLIDPDVIDKVIDFYYKGKYDYVSNSHPPTFPDGMDVEVFSFKSLQEAWERAAFPEELGEFVTVYISRNPQIFKIGNFLNKEDLYSLRLTLDGKKDLILIQKIYKELYKKNKNFGLIEILELFRKKPKLLEINRNEVSHPLSRWGKNQKHYNLIFKKYMKIKKGIKLWQKAKRLIPGGTQLLSKRSEQFLPEQWPSYFKKAKGIEVWDLDGNKYIDMSYMGIGACILGYADPDVNRAVKKVIEEGSMCTLNSPEEVELAQLLLKLHPWAEQVRYARTGGEAMAIAVRITRAYTGKDKIAFCGYHGWHDWYLAANLADDKNLDGYLLPGLEPRGVPRALKGTAIPFHYNKIEELEEIVFKNKDIGAIVMEPIRFQKPKDNFLGKVRKIADKIGAVLVFDEISSGWRFNVGGVHLKLGVNPDIAVFAKGMSNGFPMAAIIGRKKIMQAAQTTFISSTYWTERVGPAAALATINKMIDKKVPQYLEKIGKLIIKGLEKSAAANELKLEISGLPTLIHFSFDYGKDSQAIQTLFTQEMLKKGILASAGVYVSYSFKEKHVKKYLNAVDEVFAFLKKAIEKNKVYDLLKGPVAHTGFQRLT